jgi:hypothetical protein
MRARRTTARRFSSSIPECCLGRASAGDIARDLTSTAGGSAGVLYLRRHFTTARSNRQVETARIRRALVSDQESQRSCVVLSASKDLALPSVRAGAILSRAADFTSAVRGTQFSRHFSVSAVAAHVMVLYVGILAACRGDGCGDSRAIAEVRAILKDGGWTSRAFTTR